jgi:hypothetical protein
LPTVGGRSGSTSERPSAKSTSYRPLSDVIESPPSGEKRYTLEREAVEFVEDLRQREGRQCNRHLLDHQLPKRDGTQ